MGSGCLSLAVKVMVAALAATLAAISTVLLISFAVAALGQPAGAANVVKAAVATLAAAGFFLVGRAIWRELRGGRGSGGSGKG